MEIYTDFIPVMTKSPARAAIINVTSPEGINYSLSGCRPSNNSASPPWGLSLDTGGTALIRGESNVANFKCVTDAAGKTAIVRYELLF